MERGEKKQLEPFAIVMAHLRNYDSAKLCKESWPTNETQSTYTNKDQLGVSPTHVYRALDPILEMCCRFLECEKTLLEKQRSHETGNGAVCMMITGSDIQKCVTIMHGPAGSDTKSMLCWD